MNEKKEGGGSVSIDPMKNMTCFAVSVFVLFDVLQWMIDLCFGIINILHSHLVWLNDNFCQET